MDVIRNTIHAYFQSSFCLCVFTDNDSFRGNLEGIQIITYSTDNINTLEIHHHCNGIIINGDDPRSKFEAIESRIKFQNQTRVQNNRRKYLVFVAEELQCLDVFESTYLNYVIDFLNICYSECGGDTRLDDVEYVLMFYTHKYVGDDGNKPVLLDKWFSKNSTYMFGKSLDPDKLSDQEGRLLKVATFAYGPYSLPDIKSGTELSLIREFARRHNNSLEIIVNNIELWGEVFRNFSGTGVFGHVVRDEADIGFCAMFYWLSNYWYIDYSQYYVRTGVTCIVPAPNKRVKWSDVFPDLPVLVKLVIIILVLFCGLVLFLAELMYFLTYNKKSKIHSINIAKRIYLNIIQIIFILPTTTIHKSRFKCIYVCLYFLSIIMYNIHIGTFSSKLTAPRYQDSINTVEELSARNIIWIGTQANAWIESIRYDETKSFKTMVQNFRELNQTAKPSLAYAHAAERLMTGYFVIEDYISLNMLQRLVIMREDLYWQFTAFIARKNSVLLPVLNDFILRTVEAGLHLHWESQAVIYSNLEKQDTLLSLHTPHEHQLTITNFEGLFYVWLIGCAAAAITFIIELNKLKFMKCIK